MLTFGMAMSMHRITRLLRVMGNHVGTYDQAVIETKERHLRLRKMSGPTLTVN